MSQEMGFHQILHLLASWSWISQPPELVVIYKPPVYATQQPEQTKSLDMETETQWNEVSWLRWHSSKVAGLGLQFRLLSPRAPREAVLGAWLFWSWGICSCHSRFLEFASSLLSLSFCVLYFLCWKHFSSFGLICPGHPLRLSLDLASSRMCSRRAPPTCTLLSANIY